MTTPSDPDDQQPGGTKNTFHGPAAVQSGDHNVQHNYFGPDEGPLRTRWLERYLAAARLSVPNRGYPGLDPGTARLHGRTYVRQRATRIPQGVVLGEGGAPESAQASQLEAGTGFVRGDPISPGMMEAVAAVAGNTVYPGEKPDAQRRPAVAGSREVRETVPAEDALAGEPLCILFAGPGGGKSSLLQACLADGVERWLADRTRDTVPVLVPAGALTTAPLADALADFLNKDLTGLTQALPPELFSAPPCPGARWLVLVDALDEVSDPNARHVVLDRLRSITQANGDVYRFVIATRPLAHGELGAMGTETSCFRLEPFTAEDLHQVARGWFADLPDPDAVADRFVRAADRTRLAELTRIPLMASLLCQLHREAPDDYLPTSRGEIYASFVALLHKRQHSPHSADDPGRLHAGLDTFGPDAGRRADEFLDRLQDAIAWIASERRRGDGRPALDMLESLPYGRRPARVPQSEWRTFLDGCLQQSGLMTVRAGDHVFLHHTFLEHLAARHAVRAAPADALDSVFAATRSLRFWRWGHTPQDASYAGFVLDALDLDAPETVKVLRRAVRRGKSSGCLFLARLAWLGTRLPKEITDSAADRLRRETARIMISPDRSLITPANAVAWLTAARPTDLLYSRAMDPGLDPGFRTSAALELIEAGDERGAGVLADIAGDTRFFPDDRAAAAKELLWRDDARGWNLLADIECTRQDWWRRRETSQTAILVRMWRWVKPSRGRARRAAPEDPLPLRASDYPHVLVYRSAVAAHLGEAGDPDGAARALVLLLPDLTDALGPDHTETLAARNNRAIFLSRAGDLHAAVAALADLVADEVRVYGQDSARTFVARCNLPNVRGRSGDPETAATELARLLDDQIRVLGEHHPDTADIRHDLAHWRNESRQPPPLPEGPAPPQT
ncbi:NACHT domain-containing protein [Streptomyces sp. NPDC050625]|uniref:NACHT domain-containing protein n=1 Tax=Streptomyces sp. NPDC050625 TaxID=3154629 RepID=UPI003441E6E4